MRPITKLLIANRGEIVVRVARTAREMGIATVAVYSEPDAEAAHVRACDEAVALGGATPGESYLRGDALVAAAEAAGADAVHPGYGFLAENAGFARQVIDAGLVWVGPTPEAIAAMGDKLEAKAIMADAGVPVLPSIAVDEDADLDDAGREIGFPLLVKAAAGGGGKGMRVVRESSALADAVAAARREAAGAFGDDRVFLERFVERPRHVEIQILGDAHGNLVHLFERECSVQRRHQKVVEEAPSTALTPELRKSMGDAAVVAGRAIGYVNAGTVEFVLDETGEFAFLEVNTRLQVEHPVTELTTGVGEGDRSAGGAEAGWARTDLVRLQLLVAQGEPLPFAQEDLIQRGHAIEVRLYAEDPANDYLPATGTLHAFVPGRLAGVRWDAGVESGVVVSPHYDPLLAKVIAHAPTREEAVRLLARALDTTIVHGVRTNRALLAAILRDEAFLAGDTTTAFLDERFPEEKRVFAPGADAVRLAAIAAALAGERRRRSEAPVLATIPSGWRNSRGHDQRMRFAVAAAGDAGRTVEVHYRRERDGSWTVRVDGEATTVRRFGDALEVDGQRFVPQISTAEDRVAGSREWHVVTPTGQVGLSEVARFPRAGLAEVSGATLAPMPGSVVEVAVSEGEQVSAGALLVVVEAMKMEHRITAPQDGKVTEIRVAAGDQVDAGAVLVVIEGD